MLTKITGLNTVISLSEPKNSYDLKLTNGVVKISPDKNINFLYDFSVVNGVIDKFPIANSSLDSKSAKIIIINGKIKRD